MSEIDLLERDERYRVRIVRTLVVTAILALLFFGTGFYMLRRQQKASEAAAAEAALAAVLAERANFLSAFAADSTRAAARVDSFLVESGAAALEGTPLLTVKIPRGTPLVRFLEQTWQAYARVVDPSIDDEQARLWYRSYYLDAMNQAWYNAAGKLVWEGEKHPTAILLPRIRQKGKDLELEKPTFVQIVRGQEEVGLRVIEETIAVDEQLLGEESTIMQTNRETPATTPTPPEQTP